MSNSLPSLYQEFIHLSRYSRFMWDEGRRESWSETIARFFDFFDGHLKTNHGYDITALRPELEDAVLSQKVMPSMRCVMTAGEALRRENIAAYNCSYVAINSLRSFDEILYILMNGTGVGFSVESKDVEQLPVVNEDFHNTDTTIVVADSKLGWAKSLKELIGMLYVGQIPQWDLSKIRPAGAPLKTFGGRASGPEPLEALFKFCVDIFKKAAGRRLNTLEAHDIVCKIADVVVVGGVRRSALISLSDLSDNRMRVAKSGQWWMDQSQRALANNSAVYKEKPDMGLFMEEWKSLYESKSGERGIFNRASAKATVIKHGRRNPDFDFGTNPCCLVGSSEIVTHDHGKITMEKVVELFAKEKNIQVLAFNTHTEKVEWALIEAAHLTRPNAELIEIEVDTIHGVKVIRCTPDHPVYTKNRGYVRADELTEDDDLVVVV